MVVLAIDPGTLKSAYVLWDTSSEKIYDFGIVENEDLLKQFFERDIELYVDHVAIEMPTSYGMEVGQTVFDTCYWVGRFREYFVKFKKPVSRVERKREVCMELCGTTRAKDKNIIQALIDKYAPHARNRGKGTKKEPGYFYGFKEDIWQAFAVAVTFAELYERTKDIIP